MEVDFIEFYPIQVDKEKRTFSGTMHIYLVEENIDIRGVYVSTRPRGWFFQMPHTRQQDMETKKIERFPTFHFVDRSKHDELMGILKKEGSKFIKEWFKENMGISMNKKKKPSGIQVSEARKEGEQK